ncbi:MAG: peptidoglycan DD-metalloendopeptidase family protein [Lachnospiraceae bacterium]|nr:peptidoglycan DD-metalloendopeptidase family protein [Lachnospiraceae bacterium]
MKDRIRKAAGFFCLFGLVCVFGVSVFADELDDAQRRVDDLQQQQEEVKRNLENLRGVRSDLDSYIRQLDEQVAAINGQYLELVDRQAALTEELSTVRAALSDAEARSADQYENMKLRIRYIYERGDTGYFDLLFSSRDLADFLNRSEYISELTDYDRNMLKVYQETQAEIGARKEELLAKQEELSQAEEELSIQKETLELLLQAKEEELASYDARISDAQSEISDYEEALEEEQANVAALVAEIKRREEEERRRAEESRQAEESRRAEEATREQPTAVLPGDESEPPGGDSDVAGDGNGSPGGGEEAPSGSTVSGWVWPAPSCRTITDGYGGSRGHKGIDLSKPGGSYGETIVAAAAGTVVVSAYSNSAGNWVVIYHGTDGSGNDVYTCYMHCSQLLVSTGERVSAGTQIGRIGNTGASYGAHLHFEIRLNGIGVGAATVNPLQYVSP